MSPASVPDWILTVDVEDWAQSTLDPKRAISDRVDTNTRRVLDLFDRGGATGTFFILGLVAERFPGLVREIVARGHEVGSHGWDHRAVGSMGESAFRRDLRRSIHAIQDACGTAIAGFRAPDFSIAKDNTWAFEAMAEEGLLYDSSVFPFRGPRYGIRQAPGTPFRIRCRCDRSLLEFPLATMEFLGLRFPIGGGGYFRLLPYALTAACLRRAGTQIGTITFYLHPYELDPDEVHARELRVPAWLRLHQGYGRRQVERKIERLLKDFNWRPAIRARNEIHSLTLGEWDLTKNADIGSAWVSG